MSTQAADRADGGPEPKSGDRPGKKKFGLVLQGAAALGAYEAGAIEYLYESGMECAIVSGASSGAMNAATLAGAKGYPPQVLRELWGMLAVDPPIPFLPPVIRQSWSMFGVPHMYAPRLDFWNMPSWTYVSDNTPYRKTLEDLLDWDQIRDPEHMRLTVSASGVEDGGTAYFSNLDPAVPLGAGACGGQRELPGGIPLDAGRGPGLLGRRPDRQHPAQAGHRQPAGGRARNDADHHDRCLLQLAPQPANMNEVVLRMFELFLQNKLKADSETSQSYTRFISILKQVDKQLPADAPVRQEKDWEEVMNYALVRQIRMIDMKKPAGESGSDWSPEAISRRISAGYEQTRAALQETPLMA